MEHLTIDPAAIQLVQSAGQALLALVLVLVLSAFYRVYGQEYLRHWALSWLSLAFYILGTMARGPTHDGPLALRALILGLTLIASYLQVAFLLLGSYGLARGEAPGRRSVALALGLAVLVGLASVYPAVVQTVPTAGGVRCLVAGVAYLLAALVLARGGPAAPIGRNFARLALTLYALDQFAYFWRSFQPRSQQEASLTLLSVFDVLATAVIGIALVAWLLEGERERLLSAAELARRRERAQACVYRISEAAREVRDLKALCRSIHAIVCEVLPAQNFYVALYDRRSSLVSFPYFVDERDKAPSPRPLKRGLTEYVLRSGAPLLATSDVFRRLEAQGEVELIASPCVDWLGAPLRAKGETIGVAAIQTYDERIRLGPEELDLFVFVSGQIASALEAMRTSDALDNSEARLRLTMEQLPGVLWTTDHSLRFVTSAGAGLAHLGLLPNQLRGLPVEAYLREGVALAGHRRALAGESVGFEHEQDGRAFTVHLEPLRDGDGAVQGTIGIAVDVTAHRLTDLALRESEARLRQVIDLVPHFIFAKDEDGRYLLVNRAVAEAYGTTVERLTGRTDAEFASSAEEVERFRCDDLEVIRGGRPKQIPEERFTDCRGRLRWLNTSKIPLSLSGTGRTAVLGVAIDITERKAAEEALRRGAKEESLSVLAGGVAHDFNNLLAAVLGHVSLALRRLPPGGAARAHVEKAAVAVERAADLTRQMLAYSGRGHFVVAPTDLNALVEENLPLLQVTLPKSVRLVATLAPGLPAVEADVGQMQQVLMNLVINGAEAIGERKGTIEITTGLRSVAESDVALWHASGAPLAAGTYVSLEVRDDGPGMDDETVERIFEPFFSTKFTGRGLGLAAVLGVVRGHRGGLSVESAKGGGTVFRLLFAPGERPAASPSSLPPSPPSSHVRLLLIDDEDVVREMVGELLQAEGVAVLTAEDGARGVELFAQKRSAVDVVLLDLSMPGLSGEQTFAELRRIDPNVPVILSSGYDRDEAMRRFGANGPAGFIQKPYRPDRLLAEIERCLRPQAPSAS